jgi:6-phosphogluconolactonase
MYRLLAGSEFRAAIPWQSTHLFWADERCVPPDHAESNYGQARQLFIESVPLPASNVHRIMGELQQEEAVREYVGQLRLFAEEDGEWPRFDLTLLGMGEDGHTASLFPGPISDAELTAPVMAAEADYGGRPADRITLTPRAFNLSEEVLFLVSGKGKALTLSAMMNGPLDRERWPVHRIKPESGSVTWFLDEEAATELKHA